jgi:hypothetical protein
MKNILKFTLYALFLLSFSDQTWASKELIVPSSEELETLKISGYKPLSEKGMPYDREIKPNAIKDALRVYTDLYWEATLKDPLYTEATNNHKKQIKDSVQTGCNVFEKNTDKFISFLRGLKKKEKNEDIKADIESNLKLLNAFVSYFEDVFNKSKIETKTQEKLHKAVMVDHFKPFQSLFNLFMYYYDIAFPGTVGFHGCLTDWMPHELIGKELLQKIEYSRDLNGFILYRIYPSNVIDNTYSFTYVPHGDVDLETGVREMTYFSQKGVVLKKGLGNIPEIAENTGCFFERLEGGMSVMFYTGKYFIPFSFSKTVMVLNDSESSEDLNVNLKTLELLETQHSDTTDLRIQQVIKDKTQKLSKDIERSLKDMIGNKSSEGMVDINIGVSGLNWLQNLGSVVLGDKKSSFIEIPSTPIGEQENTFEYLRELKKGIESQKEEAINQAILLLGDAPPEVLIKQIDLSLEILEKDLEESYELEEKKLLEAQIQKEWEERRKKLLGGTLGDKAKQENKKKSFGHKKTFNKKTQTSVELEKKPEGLSEEHLKKIKEKVQKRLDTIKKGPMKWKTYTKFMSKLLGVLKDEKVDVKALLNKSSHGFLSIDDTKLPLFRPHKDNELYGSTPLLNLTKLTKLVFESLSKQQESKK